ncbi:hypothetical protein BS17DRAFT_815703 [Gyrodon lividus]|nr:hypothetical protein BS17DRAFT_815703 [Gyrodon lividus]
MLFTFPTVITALPFFVAAAPQPVKERGTAIPLSKRSSLANAGNTDKIYARVPTHRLDLQILILFCVDFSPEKKNTCVSHPADYPWIPSTTCTDGHVIYDPASSSTCVNLGEPFTNEYGTDVTVVTAVLILTFEQAIDQTFGIGMALRYSTLGVSNSRSPVFQTFVAQGQTDEPVFAFNVAAPRPGPSYTSVVPIRTCTLATWSPNRITASLAWAATCYKAVGGTPIPTNPRLYSFPCADVPSVSFTFGGTPFLVSLSFTPIT